MSYEKEYETQYPEMLKLAIKMAKAHWKFQSKWLGMIYEDSFIHGFMHGVEEAKK